MHRKEWQVMRVLLVVFTLTLCAAFVGGEQPRDGKDAGEQEIRKLEQRQVELLLRGEVAEMEKQWTKDFTVNNPFNKLVKGREGPVRAGQLTYSKFEREVEVVLAKGDVAVAMGGETVVPSDKSPDAGRTIRRRFTNSWVKEDCRWLLMARHASVVPPDRK